MNPLSLQLDAESAEPGVVERIRQLLHRHPGNADVKVTLVFGDGGERVLHLGEPADPFDGSLLRKLTQLPGVEVDQEGDDRRPGV